MDSRAYVGLVAISGLLGLAAALALSPLPEGYSLKHAEYPVHWHAQLSMSVDGELLFIPADVGVTPDFLESVHTHDESGVLHIEAHDESQLPPHTLAYFFGVWKQPFTDSCVGQICNDASLQWRFFVNGYERLDWTTYDLQDGDLVELVYETVPARERALVA